MHKKKRKERRQLLMKVSIATTEISTATQEISIAT